LRFNVLIPNIAIPETESATKYSAGKGRRRN
ncbi:MAG: hypothetical protein ACI965_001148, partial [Paraglaciecola sp.]